MQITYNKFEELRSLKDALIITGLSECGKYIALGNLDFKNQLLLIKIAKESGVKKRLLFAKNKDKDLSLFSKSGEVIYVESAILKVYHYLSNILNPTLKVFIDYRKEDRLKKQKKQEKLLKEAN